MQNVNAFLDEHPEEIVILDFQKVYDCSKDDHEQLIDIIQTSLGTKLLSKNHTYENLSIGQFPMSFVLCIYHLIPAKVQQKNRLRF